jgi:hypothetical protein
MRAVIQFLNAEGVKPIEIHGRIVNVYRDNCVTQRRVYECVDKFKNGLQDVEDAAWPSQVDCIVTLENICAVYGLICENCLIKVKDISEELTISTASIHNVVYKEL